MSILKWLAFTLALAIASSACNEIVDKDSFRNADIHFVVDLDGDHPKGFVDLAKEYALIHDMEMEGPHGRPGETDTDYVLSIFNEDQYEIILHSSEGTGYVYLYCIQEGSLKDAQKLMASRAEDIYRLYRTRGKTVTVMELDGWSWVQSENQSSPNFVELSTCDNRDEKVSR